MSPAAPYPGADPPRTWLAVIAKDPGENRPRLSWVTPYLAVRDAVASLRFYEQAFGFDRGAILLGEDGRPVHCEMLYRGYVVLLFAPEGAFGSTSTSPASSQAPVPNSFYLYCDDPDQIYAQAIAEGALSLSPPEDRFWGHRLAIVIDPDGYQWALAGNAAGRPES